MDGKNVVVLLRFNIYIKNNLANATELPALLPPIMHKRYNLNIMKLLIMKNIIPLLLIIIINNSCGIKSQSQIFIDYKAGRYDKAEIGLRDVIKENPNFWESYYWMGMIKYNKSEIKQSVQYFKKAISLDSTKYKYIKNDLKNSYYKLAEIYYKESKFDSSSFYYREVLNIKE